MGLFNFVKAGGKKFGSIVGTKPNVPTTKLEKTKSKIRLDNNLLNGMCRVTMFICVLLYLFC